MRHNVSCRYSHSRSSDLYIYLLFLLAVYMWHCTKLNQRLFWSLEEAGNNESWVHSVSRVLMNWGETYFQMSFVRHLSRLTWVIIVRRCRWHLGLIRPRQGIHQSFESTCHRLLRTCNIELLPILIVISTWNHLQSSLPWHGHTSIW